MMNQPAFLRRKTFFRHAEKIPPIATFNTFESRPVHKLSAISKSLILGSCLAAVSGTALANTADHHIEFDGWKLVSIGEALAAGEQAPSKEILAGKDYKAKWEYTGSKKNCTKVLNWKLKKLEPQEVTEFSHDLKTATIQESEPGNYELTVVTEGYDGRYFYNLLGCNNEAEGVVETTVKLTINDDLYTNTKYPIMIVPGVLGYDKILFGQEYFYRVGRAIEATSNQDVEDVSLDPWLNTEDRGYQLAERIVDYLIANDANFDDSAMKVNLLAHSHGSTTSRMALRILAQAFPEEKAKVASLTTVAGPHYGTPTADGAQWILENWAPGDNTFYNDGLFFINQVLFLLGDVASLGLSLLSWDFYPTDGIQDVVLDFSQRGMARFNTCYPSAGLPGGTKYFLEENFDPDPDKYHINNRENFGKQIDIARSPDGLNANITAKKCRNYGFDDTVSEQNRLASGQAALFSKTDNIQLTNEPNEAYGPNDEHPEYDPNAEGSFGDGLGEEKYQGQPGAIRYYSMTGSGEWNTTFGFGSDQNPLELADPIVALFHSAHKLVGARTTKHDWINWRDQLIDTYQSGESVDRTGLVSANTPAGITTGFQGDSDAFIPVKSTRFGQYIGTFGNWNHVDEQNGLFGWVAKGKEDADPIAVYREHANRLKNDGL